MNALMLGATVWVAPSILLIATMATVRGIRRMARVTDAPRFRDNRTAYEIHMQAVAEEAIAEQARNALRYPPTRSAQATITLIAGQSRYRLPPALVAELRRSRRTTQPFTAFTTTAEDPVTSYGMVYSPETFFHRTVHGGGHPQYFMTERDPRNDGIELRVSPPPDREYVLTVRVEGEDARERAARTYSDMRYAQAFAGPGDFIPGQFHNPGLSTQLTRINADPSYRAPSEEHLLVHADETGRLYRVRSGTSAWGSGEGKIWRAYVSVVNGTTNRAGSLDVYHLSVPVTCKTARAAVAWTYNMTEEEYAPIVRT